MNDKPSGPTGKQLESHDCFLSLYGPTYLLVTVNKGLNGRSHDVQRSWCERCLTIVEQWVEGFRDCKNHRFENNNTITLVKKH